MNNNKKKQAHPAMRRHVLGLSLIELMVALAIGSFLISGAVWVYVKSRQNYSVNESVARMQENARYAMSMLEPDIRLANYWGLINNPQIIEGTLGNRPISLPPSVQDCGNDFAIDLRVPIGGVNHMDYDASTVPCAATTASGGPRLQTADTIIVRRAGETVAAVTDNTLQLYTTLQGNSSRVYVNVPNPGPQTQNAFGPQSEIRDLVVRAYSIGTRSSVGGLPSLRRQVLRGGTTAAFPRFEDEEVLPGVEDLQIQFGIDAGADDDGDGVPDDKDGNGMPDRYAGIATRYVNPGDAALDTSQVVAVRIWVRVRAETPEQDFRDTRTYNYADITFTPNAAQSLFRRMVVSRTIQIRNTVNLQT